MSKNKASRPSGGSRELVFSVTLRDCTVQHFRSGGKGGQNQNKRDTGTRIIHPPSGAVGEARDERSQLQNTKLAFRRMVESGKFRAWVNRELHGNPPPVEERVAADMDPKNLLIMAQDDGKWSIID
jgi:RF-1 domain